MYLPKGKTKKKTEKKGMTKTEIFAKIKEAAEDYELNVTEYNGRMEIRGTWTNIIINEKMDFENFKRDEKEITAGFTADCSICRMGGNTTSDDLFAAAEEIRKAAALTESINGKKYSCIYRMD